MQFQGDSTIFGWKRSHLAENASICGREEHLVLKKQGVVRGKVLVFGVKTTCGGDEHGVSGSKVAVFLGEKWSFWEKMSSLRQKAGLSVVQCHILDGKCHRVECEVVVVA